LAATGQPLTHRLINGFGYPAGYMPIVSLRGDEGPVKAVGWRALPT